MNTYRVLRKKEIDFSDAPKAPIATYKWCTEYQPKAYAQLIYVENVGIAAKLTCFENSPKAVYTDFGQPVYKDSCMEFFFGMDHSADYINCEMNSNGAALMEYGVDRNGRARLDTITECPTIKAEKNGESWSVQVLFTFETIEKVFGDCPIRNGGKFYGNFYKCGDECEIMHYGMWNEIASEKANYHLSRFFGEFVIEE